MDFLAQYGMFALKSLTLVLSVLFLVGGVFALTRKSKSGLNIHFLNDDYYHLTNRMEKTILGKVSKKIKPKNMKSKKKSVPIVYVIDFDGDIKASQVEPLREEISAILTVATKHDEVFIRLESPGGSVNGYGLAAAQLQRLRDRGVRITACIDKVAASGGYLMACVAHQIIAAPFSIIGSIGVVAQMPNFHRWLQKNDIDVELLTAGEYKRTLTVFGKNTPKGRAKFQEDLEQIHKNFRDYVIANRSNLDIDQVTTGEHWLAMDALNLRLIDKIQTSDECIIDKIQTHHVYHVKVYHKPTWIERVLNPAAKLLNPFA